MSSAKSTRFYSTKQWGRADGQVKVEEDEFESRHEFETDERRAGRAELDDSIECVLSTARNVSRTTRADDLIPYSRESPSNTSRHSPGPPKHHDSDDFSVTSRWAKPSRIRPLFGSDDRSVTSTLSISSHEKSVPNNKVKDLLTDQDDPWRAAKRGDLNALKRFHSRGTDWSREDANRNVPLYYACRSGAIVDIMAVRFLIWVTPNTNPRVIKKCRKNAMNQPVLDALDSFEKGASSSAKARKGTIVASSVPPKSKPAVELPKTLKTPKNGFSFPNGQLESQLEKAKQESQSEKAKQHDTIRASGRPPRSKGPSRGALEPEREPESSDQSFVSTLDDDSWSLGSILSLRKKRNKSKKMSKVVSDALQLPRESRQDHDPQPTLSVSSGRSYEKKSPSRSIGRYTPNLPTTAEGAPIRKESFDSRGTKQSTRSIDVGRRRNQLLSPSIEYQEEERKWIITNQIKPDGPNREKLVLAVHVYDPKQQVYIANCHGVSIHIHGRKTKALMIDSCSNINIIFDTVVSACEVVNCTQVAIQSTGLCPTFAIDKTDGIVVWLTKESAGFSNFITSKCTEVNISIPTGDGNDAWDRKEVSLPDQFVHKIAEGRVTSHVSGLYR